MSRNLVIWALAVNVAVGDLVVRSETVSSTEIVCEADKPLRSHSKGLPIKKIPKNFLWCGTNCPLIIKDRQDAHPTKLGNLLFGVP
ncbi:hypothetical protein AA650_16905 [Anabaena sp. WA102]|nr:hypothetical protein AA650_16905 [Anabaena sp. WA102]